MWKSLVEQLTSDCSFSRPASPAEVAAVESILHIELPADLKDLLLESNGMFANYGTHLIWSTDEIREHNLFFRNDPGLGDRCMPFDPLLFFADAGNGDQFAFVITRGVIKRPDVFLWDHETDSRSFYAPSLQRYLEWWLKQQAEP
jgi:hypothetical protein